MHLHGAADARLQLGGTQRVLSAKMTSWSVTCGLALSNAVKSTPQVDDIAYKPSPGRMM